LVSAVVLEEKLLGSVRSSFLEDSGLLLWARRDSTTFSENFEKYQKTHNHDETSPLHPFLAKNLLGIKSYSLSKLIRH